mgnify:CR=1 FL=1
MPIVRSLVGSTGTDAAADARGRRQDRHAGGVTCHRAAHEDTVEPPVVRDHVAQGDGRVHVQEEGGIAGVNVEIDECDVVAPRRRERDGEIHDQRRGADAALRDRRRPRARAPRVARGSSRTSPRPSCRS